MLIALRFPKPPANITSALLFGKVEPKVMYPSLFLKERERERESE
jgi:hypothetical protein